MEVSKNSGRRRSVDRPTGGMHADLMTVRILRQCGSYIALAHDRRGCGSQASAVDNAKNTVCAKPCWQCATRQCCSSLQIRRYLIVHPCWMRESHSVFLFAS
eukprot:IDg19651t1